MTNPAGLKSFQRLIASDTLYQVNSAPNLGGVSDFGGQLAPSIELLGTSGDVYGSQILPADAPTGMPKILTAATGLHALAFIPNYLYVHPTSVSFDSITLSGVNSVEVLQPIAENQIIVYTSAALELV